MHVRHVPDASKDPKDDGKITLIGQAADGATRCSTSELTCHLQTHICIRRALYSQRLYADQHSACYRSQFHQRGTAANTEAPMRINISIDLEASEIDLANEIISTLKCAALPHPSRLSCGSIIADRECIVFAPSSGCKNKSKQTAVYATLWLPALSIAWRSVRYWSDHCKRLSTYSYQI